LPAHHAFLVFRVYGDVRQVRRLVVEEMSENGQSALEFTDDDGVTWRVEADRVASTATLYRNGVYELQLPLQ
jgi:hypothetical protein